MKTKSIYQSTKILELGSCAFRQWRSKPRRCGLIHGYQLKAKFWFGCRELDHRNWAVDFGGLTDLKKTLRDQFDHTLCVAEDDPCLELFQELHNKGACELKVMPAVGVERTAKWCFDAAKEFLLKEYGDRVWVEKVEVFEHDQNSATYEEGYTIDYREETTDCSCCSDAACCNAIQNLQPSEIADINALNPIYDVVETQSTQPALHAQVGNRVSGGMSDMFAGTSWGKR